MVIVSQRQYDEMVELMQQLREKKSDDGFTQALSQRFDELIAGMNRPGQARLALLGGGSSNRRLVGCNPLTSNSLASQCFSGWKCRWSQICPCRTLDCPRGADPRAVDPAVV